jgi:5'-nucleotidase
MLDWQSISVVFLDMDGTLLDLHFDNHFWLEHVPNCYAEKNSLSQAQARQQLYALYEQVVGTMDWYCLDYWSNALNMDIPVLKQDVDHLIKVHPHVVAFLDLLRQKKKRVVMVTNAHQKSLSLKMEKTQLGGHFDRLISSHEIGVPKENADFWHKLQLIEPFQIDQTLLVDDSISVLKSAENYGFKHILAILKPDSQNEVIKVDDFTGVENFDAVMAGLIETN